MSNLGHWYLVTWHTLSCLQCFELVTMATMNRPIMLLLTVIQIWNKYLKFQLNRVVYLCLCYTCTKFKVDTLFLSWVLFNNLTSIYSIWQRPWNHSTNIFIRIFLLHRIHCRNKKQDTSFRKTIGLFPFFFLHRCRWVWNGYPYLWRYGIVHEYYRQLRMHL